MRVLDLFSGIGAFSLGLERAGMTTISFCEIDPFCRKVLAKHWPEVPCHHECESFRPSTLLPQDAEISTSSAEASPARTSASQAAAQELPASDPASGPSSPDSLARYDRATSSWRTSQLCLDEDWERFSETWPRSGMMRSGIAFPLPPLARPTSGTASGSWPTPTGWTGRPWLGTEHVGACVARSVEQREVGAQDANLAYAERAEWRQVRSA